MSDKKFYDLGSLLSYNKIFSYSVGSRGIGKSFAVKEFMVKNWLKKRQQFIYVRRHKNDIQVLGDGFFDDISIHFEGEEFEVKGGEIYEYIINGEVAGYGIGLSQYKKMKSVPKTDVFTIFYDEFLPEQGESYLGGQANWFYEVNACLSLYQSVARGGGKAFREGVRFIFAANATNIYNPFFVYFGIDKRLKPETKFMTGEGWVVEMARGEAITEEIAQTQFGKMIKGTQYGAMALDNVWFQNDTALIEKHKGQARYLCTLVSHSRNYGVYHMIDDGCIQVTERPDMSSPYKYTLSAADHRSSYTNVRMCTKAWPIVQMKESWNRGELFFDNQRCKQMWLEFMHLDA